MPTPNDHRVARDHDGACSRPVLTVGETVMPGLPAAAMRACRSRAADWRQQAAYLRTHATLAYLNDQQRTCLLREAEAADRLADWWLAGAADASRQGSRVPDP